MPPYNDPRYARIQRRLKILSVSVIGIALGVLLLFGMYIKMTFMLNSNLKQSTTHTYNIYNQYIHTHHHHHHQNEINGPFPKWDHIHNAYKVSLNSYSNYKKMEIYYNDSESDTLYIGFKGTTNDPSLELLSHVFTDFLIFTDMHVGFTRRANEYFAHDSFDIWFNNITHQYQFSHLVLCGHSLGGAVAQIMSIYFLNYSYFSDIQYSSEVITFGSPLVFRLGTTPHPNVTHVINPTDIVPILLRNFEILFIGPAFLRFHSILQIFCYIMYAKYIFVAPTTQITATSGVFIAVYGFLSFQPLTYYITHSILLSAVYASCWYRITYGINFFHAVFANNNLKTLLIIMFGFCASLLICELVYPQYEPNGLVLHVGNNGCYVMSAKDWYSTNRYVSHFDFVMDDSLTEYEKVLTEHECTNNRMLSMNEFPIRDFIRDLILTIAFVVVITVMILIICWI